MWICFKYWPLWGVVQNFKNINVFLTCNFEYVRVWVEFLFEKLGRNVALKESRIGLKKDVEWKKVEVTSFFERNHGECTRRAEVDRSFREFE